MPQQDSLRKRYFYKLFGNIASVLGNAVTQMIIPRALGALQYGNFCFLTDAFTQFMAFFNMGSSVGFYTKLSKRPHENGMVAFYLFYIVCVILLAALFVFIASGVGFQHVIWPGQDLRYIYAAVCFAGLTWVVSTVNDVIDAHGFTVQAEKFKVLQRVITVGILLVLFVRGWIDLGTAFCFYYVTFLILILFFVYVLRRNGKPLCFSKLSVAEGRSYGLEFFHYSKPLFVWAVVGFLINIFDRWFLQVLGGGIQQGFYGLAFKIGALCFLLTSAMTQLITREFSVAYGKKDLPLMAQLFRKHIPLLYGLTALMACFVSMNSDKVATIMGGAEFKGATLPLSIMVLYPLWQTYGQLSDSLFFATDQVRLYRNISVAVSLIGVPTTLFLLSPKAYHGLSLGATGLAIKMLLLNMLAVNVGLFFNARFLKLPFGWYLRHQAAGLAVFLGVAFLAATTADYFIKGEVWFRLIGSGSVYLVACAAAVYFCPWLLGFQRRDIMHYWEKLVLIKRTKI